LAKVSLNRKAGLPATDNLTAGKLSGLPFAVGKRDLATEARASYQQIAA
jgi:hypothetical protein